MKGISRPAKPSALFCRVCLFCLFCTLLQGCGLVEFASREGAEKAMEDLHMRFCWDKAESFMVVEWMNQSKQRSAGKGAAGKGE